MVKTTINLSDDLHSKVVKRAEELGVAKSAVVALCVEKYFQEQDAMSALPQLIELALKSDKLAQKK